jgi:RNA polymerase sigma factor (sigma-70 family)
LGTDAHATTAGTTAEEAGDEPPIRFRGDELDLYGEYHVELIRKITRDVNRASPETIEDACALAWVEFLKKQPDRDNSWQGWLYTVAKREAWRLNALEWKERAHVFEDGTPIEQADPRDRLEERLEFQAALQELGKLPPRFQEVVMIRSQVWKQADVAEIMGLSRPRVAQMLIDAAARVAELNERRHDAERPVASPRAARLRELEDNPPTWLSNAIGRKPPRNKSSAGITLAWRRAALAIDDYRNAHRHDSPTDAIGPTPLEPAARRAFRRAERAIAEVDEERMRRKHGLGRGR